MAFRSEAHKRKIEELVKKGKISQEAFDEMTGATGNKKLPARLRPSARRKRERKGRK